MKQLALRSFRLQNFKAVRDSGTIRFGPLTVFIGNNGSGKSSLIEGMETFRDVVFRGLDVAMNRWRGFEHVWNHAAPHVLQRSATARACHTNPLGFQATGYSEKTRFLAAMRINLGEDRIRLFLQREQCKRSRRDFSSEHVRDDEGNVFVSGFSRSSSRGASGSANGPKPASSSGRSTSSSRSRSGDSSGRSTSSSRSRLGEHHLADGESCLTPLLGTFLDSWQFLMLDPEQMGEPTPQQRATRRIRLARNGANIAEYLNEIHGLDQPAFQGVVDALRSVLPYPTDLQPSITSELERKFYLKMKETEFEVPGWLLSTGTLRILALLALLRHPEPPTLIAIEEIENGLDPRTIHMLVEEIRVAVESGRTQVIATTHSPYLLDLLPLSAIVLVDRAEGESRFIRPADSAEVQQWAKNFAPGQLYTMNRLHKEGRP